MNELVMKEETSNDWKGNNTIMCINEYIKIW